MIFKSVIHLNIKPKSISLYLSLPLLIQEINFNSWTENLFPRRNGKEKLFMQVI